MYNTANEHILTFYFLQKKNSTHFKYLVDLSWAGGRNSEKSLHESDLLDRHPSLVFMALTKRKEIQRQKQSQTTRD